MHTYDNSQTNQAKINWHGNEQKKSYICLLDPQNSYFEQDFPNVI